MSDFEQAFRLLARVLTLLMLVSRCSEDWDYQDFSPDKRCALLDQEIVSSVADDERLAEASATEAVKNVASQRLDWKGLSPDAELAEFDSGADNGDAALGIEGRLVALSTPPGGIQGMPDADGLQRLLAHAPRLEVSRMTAALAARLQHKTASGCWQVRAKTLVVMQLLVESKPLAARFLPAFRADGQLLRQLDALRTADRNASVRESARKLLSLVGSNGSDPMLIPRQPSPVKPHVRHHHMTSSSAAKKSATAQQPVPSTKVATDRVTKKTAGLVAKPTASKPTMKVNTAVANADTSSTNSNYQHTSPKIACAAMASWRRRSMASRPDDGAHLMPYQQPTTWSNSKSGFGGNEAYPPTAPAFTPAITTSGNASRYQSGQLSAFTFMH